MNPYLSRDEKENFVRLLIVRPLINRIIETYAQLKSTDKHFLTVIKTANTWLQKGLDLRMDYLDNTAKENLVILAAKQHFMFLPTDKAKKENEDLLKMRSVLPMQIEDFQAWYEFVIEHTCKICEMVNYQECPARRIMMKYDIYPYDPAANDHCQYSYRDM